MTARRAFTRYPGATPELDERASQAILEQAGEGFVLVDDGGVISAWNLAMERISGVKRADTIGRPVWDVQAALIWFPRQRKREVVQKLKQAWRGRLRRARSPALESPTEAVIVRPDGKLRSYERVVFPVEIGNKRVFGILVRETTERQRAREALKTSRARLRTISHRIESVREEAQRQIARELHDGIGQAVSALAMSVGWIARRLPRTAAREVLAELKAMESVLGGLTTQVQGVAMRLGPRILDSLGLKEAVITEARSFSERTGIPCVTELALDQCVLGEAEVTALFRICQEALTNIYRHASASEVRIALRERDGRVVLAVSDNGCGITHEQMGAPRSLGIFGMQERALALGGEFKIVGERDAGTMIEVSLPLAQRLARAKEQ